VLKTSSLPAFGKFLLQPAQHLIEQRHGPTILINRFRSPFVARFQPVPLFGGVGVDGDNRLPSTALLGSRPLPVFHQKTIERRQEK
jgi:hypothetical protein